jgi:uncharacterized protein YndB with AHSA1/START domain
MSTVSVSPDQDVIVAEIQIAAPPDRVFQAITDPKQVPQWWGQQGMYRVTEWEADLRPGGRWRSSGVGADGKTFEVVGDYVEIDPPRLLVHTWNPTWAQLPTTTVRWELKAHQGGTLVTLHHSGFAGHAESAQDHSKGWTRVLGWMQAFVERRQTIDSRK